MAEVQILKASETQCDLFAHELRVTRYAAALALKRCTLINKMVRCKSHDRLLPLRLVCIVSRTQHVECQLHRRGPQSHAEYSSTIARFAEQRARKRKREKGTNTTYAVPVESHTTSATLEHDAHGSCCSPLTHATPPRTAANTAERHISAPAAPILLFVGLARVDRSARESLVRTPNFVLDST